jgi:3-isopropylmalate dehydrogenase
VNKILVLPGDGVGKEVTDGAVKVIEAVDEAFKIDHIIEYEPFGGSSYDMCGDPCPDSLIERAGNFDAIFLGAVGHPKYDGVESHLRPEAGLLKIRKKLDLYSNIRPIKYYDILKDSLVWKEEIIKNTDIVFVRELTGGAYFGKKERNATEAIDVIEYKDFQIERIAKVAFEVAKNRKKKLHVIDKANVLETSKLWREIVEKVKKNNPDIEVIYQYVDNAAAQLILKPTQYDVILTENMFGDILSDAGAVIGGSLGMLPSASIGDKISLYEPAHGSAPDIAGMGVVNPVASILSVALMYRYSFKREDVAVTIEKAVEKTLSEGYLTPDIAKDKKIGTEEMINKIIKNLDKKADQ